MDALDLQRANALTQPPLKALCGGLSAEQTLPAGSTDRLFHDRWSLMDTSDRFGRVSMACSCSYSHRHKLALFPFTDALTIAAAGGGGRGMKGQVYVAILQPWLAGVGR